MAEMDSDLESVESTESDKELQAAFASGLLKPGLNIEAPAPKKFINDVAGLHQALNDLQRDLPWMERLDLTLDPLPGHKALELAEDTQADSEGGVHDDFKREMRFYRQAQAAVQEGLPRLKSLNIPTKRPEDYFAEMAKSDAHMKKVREKLLAKQIGMERSEKAKKLRDLRKYGKKVQQDVLQQRQKDKKEMMEAVKKYRKGKETKLDFLDDQGGPKQQKQGGKNVFKPNQKRAEKNKKYGFGGQKKRMKHNTAKSSNDMSDFSVKKHASRPSKFKKSNPKGGNNRPGKKRRQNMKNKKR